MFYRNHKKTILSLVVFSMIYASQGYASPIDKTKRPNFCSSSTSNTCIIKTDNKSEIKVNESIPSSINEGVVIYDGKTPNTTATNITIGTSGGGYK